MAEELNVQVTVNGRRHDRTVEPRRLLADFLREDLGLTGTHLGCEHGVCGACTVLVEGRPVRSCLMLAAQADGADVRTVEGLAGDGPLHPLQEAFRRHHALQCGFCTPGFLMTASALLADRAGDPPTDEEVRHELSGVLCRCTGYQNIVKAVLSARDQITEGGTGCSSD
jgi:aerobic-type carbon monoxide dehydrogenase small subunit (CoxS/CutS family)